MQHQPLQQVIDTEDEIKRQIAAERARAAEWLASVKHECAAEKETQRQQLEESFNRKVDETRRRRQAAAKELLADAEQKAQSFGERDEAGLRDLLRRRLDFILPGRNGEEIG